MSLFSDEVRQRCNLGDLVAEEIAALPEIEGCLVDEIPILESISVIPVDGGDGCDGIDGYDAQDAADGVDGRDGLDAMDGYDGQDGHDGVDGRDGCDAIDGFDAQDGTDGVDGRDGQDAIDGFDAQDGADGADGRDGLDAMDGYDAQDAADGVDGRDGLDAIDGYDAQDAADGADGRDGCDAIDGFDAQDGSDGTDGRDGRDGCDGLDGHDAQDGTDGVDGRDSSGLCIRATNATGRNLPFGSAVGVSVSSLPKPPIDPPTGIGLAALLIEAERFHYFEDRSYHVVLPSKNTTLGITTEPIDTGDTGCIALSGIVRAVVNVRDTSHDAVTFTNGTTLLESTDSDDTEHPGQLSFLIRPTATGRQWCDLMFGVSGGGGGVGSEVKLGVLSSQLNGSFQIYNPNKTLVYPYFTDENGFLAWSTEVSDEVYASTLKESEYYPANSQITYSPCSNLGRFEVINGDRRPDPTMKETNLVSTLSSLGGYIDGGLVRAVASTNLLEQSSVVESGTQVQVYYDYPSAETATIRSVARTAEFADVLNQPTYSITGQNTNSASLTVTDPNYATNTGSRLGIAVPKTRTVTGTYTKSLGEKAYVGFFTCLGSAATVTYPAQVVVDSPSVVVEYIPNRTSASGALPRWIEVDQSPGEYEEETELTFRAVDQATAGVSDVYFIVCVSAGTIGPPYPTRSWSTYHIVPHDRLSRFKVKLVLGRYYAIATVEVWGRITEKDDFSTGDQRIKRLAQFGFLSGNYTVKPKPQE